MRLRKITCVFTMFLLLGAGAAWGFDVSIKAPQLGLTGELATVATDAGIGVEGINRELRDQATLFQTELENDEDLRNFRRQPKLAEGFANAGATSAHLGTQRSFIDYRLFAFVIGTGAAVSAPSNDPDKVQKAAEAIEDEGDIYLGAAFQPISASLGINLSRLVNGLRVNAKIGYANIAEGTVQDGVSFESLSLGVGASYQLVQPRSLPAGIIRWRGLSVGTGFNYQRNLTEIEFAATGEDGFRSAVSFADVGLGDAADTGLIDGVSNASDNFGFLLISPELLASIESRTYAVPLEINTGIRLLYLLDLNVGAGVDLVFGDSKVAVGSKTKVGFEANTAIEDQVTVSSGSADFGIKTSTSPQLLRPRLTAGVGVNLGPIRLDVPLMYYFDSEGPGAMVGVNLGIVW